MQRPQLAPAPFLNRKSRRGSVIGLLAFTLPVLLIMVAVVVNASYMQLTRTELVIATDASARSAGRVFSELQTVNDAKIAAKVTAAKNVVAGEAFKVRTQDKYNEVEFGNTTNTGTNYMKFTFNKVPTWKVKKGLEQASAVRVNGLRTSSSAGGSVNLALPNFLPVNNYQPTHDSVAMQVDRDIALVLDRSGSMDSLVTPWPPGKSPNYTSTKNAAVAAGILTSTTSGGGKKKKKKKKKFFGKKKSGGTTTYSPAPGYTWDDYTAWAWEVHYGLGEYQGTKWESLERSVDSFLDVLNQTQPEEHVSVASYSSASSASLDIYLQSNYSNVSAEIDTLYPSGSTGIGAGMEKAILSFLHASARPYAAKTMVVMTDGMHNSGTSPVPVATTLCSQYNLTIHTITFGDGADENLMRQVATIGGGKHYHAQNSTQLEQVFEEIANNLPTIITE